MQPSHAIAQAQPSGTRELAPPRKPLPVPSSIKRGQTEPCSALPKDGEGEAVLGREEIHTEEHTSLSSEAVHSSNSGSIQEYPGKGGGDDSASGQQFSKDSLSAPSPSSSPRADSVMRWRQQFSSSHLPWLCGNIRISSRASSKKATDSGASSNFGEFSTLGEQSSGSSTINQTFNRVMTMSGSTRSPVNSTASNQVRQTNFIARRVYCGDDHGLGLMQDGSLWVWGDDGMHKSVQPTCLSRLSSMGVRDVACGKRYTVVLTKCQKVFVWGEQMREISRLQIPSTANQTVTSSAEIVHSVQPAPVSVAAGFGHRCVLLEDGTALMWGDNNRGQLGIGNMQRHEIPQVLPLHVPVVQTACGRDHSLFLDVRGKVWVSGSNAKQQIGIKGRECHTPTCLDLPSHIMSVVASWYGSALLDNVGRCLAAGSLHPSGKTIPPKGFDWLEAYDICKIAAGATRAVYITKGGRAYSWGIGDGLPVSMSCGGCVSDACAGDKWCAVVCASQTDSRREFLKSRRHQFLSKGKAFNVAVITANVGCHPNPTASDLRFVTDAIESCSSDSSMSSSTKCADVVFITLQEVDMSAGALLTTETEAKAIWTEAVSAAVKCNRTSEKYRLLAVKQQMGLMAFIYRKQSCGGDTQLTQTALLGTGIGNKGANKGGIAFSMLLEELPVCFIGSHLAARDENVEKRNKNYTDIATRIFSKQGQLPVFEHAVVLWSGDLNYRINLPREFVLECIAKSKLKDLQAYDQLKLSQKSGDAFVAFQELEISFNPTYRYDVGTDTYDTGKKLRTPAWCDRVLLRDRTEYWGEANAQLVDGSYRRYDDCRISDHRPVVAGALVTAVRADEDARQLVLDEYEKCWSSAFGDLTVSVGHGNMEGNDRRMQRRMSEYSSAETRTAPARPLPSLPPSRSLPTAPAGSDNRPSRSSPQDSFDDTCSELISRNSPGDLAAQRARVTSMPVLHSTAPSEGKGSGRGQA